MFDIRSLAIRKYPYAFEYITEDILIHDKKYYKLENCNGIVSEDNIILGSNNWAKDIKELQMGQLVYKKEYSNDLIYFHKHVNKYVKDINFAVESIDAKELFPEFKLAMVQWSQGYYLICNGDSFKDLFVKELLNLNNLIKHEYVYFVTYDVVNYKDYSNSYQDKEVFNLVGSYQPKWSIDFNIIRYKYIDWVNYCLIEEDW